MSFSFNETLALGVILEYKKLSKFYEKNKNILFAKGSPEYFFLGVRGDPFAKKLLIYRKGEYFKNYRKGEYFFRILRFFFTLKLLPKLMSY